MAVRIAIVGGGSTHWAPRLLGDLANTPSLQDAAVVLQDIDEAALGPMASIGKAIAAGRGIGLQVSTTTELPRALDGAQFVITAFSVGGFTSMTHDVEIPARHGVFQPVGDSVGPGGISRSLRSIPVLVEIARQVERCAPEALLLNVSNPLSALCRAVTRCTSVRAVGLCSELVGLQFWLSLLFDVPMREVDPVVAGVNHLPLVTALRIGGEDGFAMLSAAMADRDRLSREPVWMDPPEQSHWRRVDPGRAWSKADVLANNRLKLQVFEDFGVLPGSADTHVAEFFPWFVTEVSDQGRRWGVHHYGMHGHRADKAADDAEVERLLAGGGPPSHLSGELVAPLLDAVTTGRARSLPVNLPNVGQVTDLPEGIVVECMGRADGSGVHPRDVASAGPLSEHLRRVVAAQELTVEAALTGDRALVRRAMLSDPVAGSLPWEVVTSIVDELLSATAPWLPQFSR
jgi:alpha-galactosidase